jgi:hypothetical protein
MSTIFTDDFVFTEAETQIYIDDAEPTYTGRDLIIYSGNCEVRLRLTDKQFEALGAELIINGFIEEAGE